MLAANGKCLHAIRTANAADIIDAGLAPVSVGRQHVAQRPVFAVAIGVGVKTDGQRVGVVALQLARDVVQRQLLNTIGVKRQQQKAGARERVLVPRRHLARVGKLVLKAHRVIRGGRRQTDALKLAVTIATLADEDGAVGAGGRRIGSKHLANCVWLLFGVVVASDRRHTAR